MVCAKIEAAKRRRFLAHLLFLALGHWPRSGWKNPTGSRKVSFCSRRARSRVLTQFFYFLSSLEDIKMKKWKNEGIGRGAGEGKGLRKVFGGPKNRVPNNFSRLDTAGNEIRGRRGDFWPGFWPVAFRFPAKAPNASKTHQNGPRLRQNWVVYTRVA